MKLTTWQLFCIWIFVELKTADYTHIGCFADSAKRCNDLDHGRAYSTIDQCATACVGYSFMALEDGYCNGNFRPECRCCNSYAAATSGGPSGSCRGCTQSDVYKGDIGGAWALDLYIFCDIGPCTMQPTISPTNQPTMSPTNNPT
eukprot:534796_1